MVAGYNKSSASLSSERNGLDKESNRLVYGIQERTTEEEYWIHSSSCPRGLVKRSIEGGRLNCLAHGW